MTKRNLIIVAHALFSVLLVAGLFVYAFMNQDDSALFRRILIVAIGVSVLDVLVLVALIKRTR